MDVKGWKGTAFPWRVEIEELLEGPDFSVYSERANHSIIAPNLSKANATGIAALGQLIEALQDMLERFAPFAEITINGQHDNGDVAAVDKARAALRAAGIEQ